MPLHELRCLGCIAAMERIKQGVMRVALAKGTALAPIERDDQRRAGDELPDEGLDRGLICDTRNFDMELTRHLQGQADVA